MNQIKFKPIAMKSKIKDRFLSEMFLVDARISRRVIGELKQILRRGFSEDLILKFECKHLVELKTKYLPLGINFDPERGISCMSYDLKHYVIAD